MATITPAEFATEVNSDSRTVRKFLRSVTAKENQPGKGGSWKIEKRDVSKLRRQFNQWNESKPEPTTKVQAAPPEIVEEVDENSTVVDFTGGQPTS